MPDGAYSPVDLEAQDAPTLAADARLLERVWRNLTLWSGGTTLLVLLDAVGRALRGRRRIAGQCRRRPARAPVRSGDAPAAGSRTTTRAWASSSATRRTRSRSIPTGRRSSGRGSHLPDGFPYEPGVEAAAGGGRDIQTATIGETPVRVLTQEIVVDGSTYTLQIIQDRTVEQQTLQIMLAILLIGGLVVIVVAFGFGTIYARRALVPIRESLAGQRAALRRQREFAADASHELRTPLTVIRSSVEHLERHRSEPVESVGSALVDIDDEVRHMTAIVEDLLLLARSDSGAVQLEHLPGRPERRRRRRRVLDDQARRGSWRLDRGGVRAGGRHRRCRATAPARRDPRRQRHPPQPDRRTRSPSTSATRPGRRRPRRSSSRTRARASPRRTCRTCSSASTAPPAHPAAAPAWAWPSRPGSSTATAAGSPPRTGPKAARGSVPRCRRVAHHPRPIRRWRLAPVLGARSGLASAHRDAYRRPDPSPGGRSTLEVEPRRRDADARRRSRPPSMRHRLLDGISWSTSPMTRCSTGRAGNAIRGAPGSSVRPRSARRLRCAVFAGIPDIRYTQRTSTSSTAIAAPPSGRSSGTTTDGAADRGPRLRPLDASATARS